MEEYFSVSPHCEHCELLMSLGIPILVAHSLCGMFGAALGALGMLGTLTMGLTIDAFGPISDNAGGIAEISQLMSGSENVPTYLTQQRTPRRKLGKVLQLVQWLL